MGTVAPRRRCRGVRGADGRRSGALGREQKIRGHGPEAHGLVETSAHLARLQDRRAATPTPSGIKASPGHGRPDSAPSHPLVSAHGVDADHVAALAEPTRRRLYETAVRSREPIDRDTAAESVGISRHLAAFHLDRLVAAGLLEPTYQRRSGRTGPGAGRPAKFYRRSGVPIAVSLPPRRYELAAELFAAALEQVDAEAHAALVDAARSYGVALGPATDRNADDSAETLLGVLAAAGFEPEPDPAAGLIRLRNCPFDALVADHRALTCAMNLALLEGVGEALGPDFRPERRTEEGFCCVALRDARSAPPNGGLEIPGG